MNIIQQVTSDPLQTRSVRIPNNNLFTFTMYFMPMQQSWFITNLTYLTFVLNGLRISNSPNILHQWRNILPFGLACFSTNDREPQLVDDFSNGLSNLYLLSQADCQAYEEFLTSGS